MVKFLVAAALFITGCSTPPPPLATVSQVDLQKYLGTWYEIARYEHFFEEGCSDVSATYSLKTNGNIKVVNRCVKIGNVKSEAVGVAHNVDESNSKLKVSFFRPFYGNYWILMLDSDYTYAVIGDPSREYFWILSRTKILAPHIVQNILNKLPEWGYNEDKLTWTLQHTGKNNENF